MTMTATLHGRLTEARTGGENGYRAVGYEIARSIADLAPGVEPDEWDERVIALERLLEPLPGLHPTLGVLTASDDQIAPVLAWLDENLPRCMAHVPARRRRQLVIGHRRVGRGARPLRVLRSHGPAEALKTAPARAGQRIATLRIAPPRDATRLNASLLVSAGRSPGEKNGSRIS